MIYKQGLKMTQQNFNDAEIQESIELMEEDSNFNKDDWYDHEDGEDNLDDFMDINTRSVLFFN